MSMLLITATMVASPALAQDGAELAAEAREAMGIEAEPRTVRLVGRAEQTGLEGRVELVFRGDGASRRTFEGPVSQVGGNEGSTSWEVDWGGVARTFDLGEHDGSVVNAALLTGAWARADGPLVLRAAPEGTRGPAVGFTLAAGHVDGVIELDPESKLPRVARWTTGGSETELEFERWSDGPRRWPMAIRRTVAGKVSGYDAEEIEREPVLGDDPFALPRATAPASFDPDVPAALEVDRAPSGHLLVRPKVDGKDIGWFIFDTGAGENCIDKGAAEELGLDALGTIVAMGVGGRTDQSLRVAGSLTLGPMTLHDPIFVDLDLAFLEGPFGRKIGGIIGYGAHARCVFEYEPSTPYLALHDASKFTLPEALSWGELSLYQRHPVIRGSADGIEAYFNVDSGADGTCVFHSPFVDRHGLLDGRETRVSRAGGVGGSVVVREGAVDSLILAGREFGPLDVGFARTEVGAFADPYLAGNLGAEIFGTMRTVFDYANRRVAFAPLAGGD